MMEATAGSIIGVGEVRLREIDVLRRLCVPGTKEGDGQRHLRLLEMPKSSK